MMDAKTGSLKQLNMDILMFRYAILDSSWKVENVCASFTRIYMITKGEAFLYYKGGEVKMLPGYVYVVPAGIRLSYECKDTCEKYFFHISICNSNGYDVFENIDKIFSFNDQTGIEFIIENSEADTVSKIMNIKSYLYKTVSKCLAEWDSIDVKTYSENVDEIINYIENNLSSSLCVNEISESLFLSPAKVRKIFKDEVGIPIGKYIDDRVMHYAEAEIRRGKLSIKEISDKLKFCDQFYFSRCFSKKYGHSPTRYIKDVQYKK